jgi:methyl-accepting chemotaxis protein
MSQLASSSVSLGQTAKKGGEPRYILTAKLVWLMLLVSVVPLLVLGAAWLRESGRQIRDENDLLMNQTAEGLAGQVDEWIDKNVRILQAAARMPAVTSMAAASQEAVTKAIQETYPWMYLVFTVGMDGKSVARSDGKPAVDYSDRLYFRDVAHLGQPLAWQTLVGKTSGVPALVLAVPVLVNGNRVGVVAAAMTLGDISKTVATWRKGQTGFAFLLDEQNKVLSHPRRDLVVAQTELKDHPLVRAVRKVLQQSQAMPFINPEGRAVVGLGRTNKYGWMLAIEQSEDEVFAELRKVQFWGAALLAVTAILVSLIAWRTARSLVRPIVQLTQMADRMSTGELDVKLDIRSRDEIGMLAQAFGRMQNSLRKAMERLEQRAG